MIIRLLSITTFALLAACAATPESSPQSMSLYPAPLPGSSMNRPGVSVSDTGSMQPFVAPPGSSVVRPGSTDADTGSMAIPESSMGNLRQRAPATR